MRWVWRGSAATAVVIGWGFFFRNNMHITPRWCSSAQLRSACGHLHAFKTGAAAVSSRDDDDDTSDAAWGLMVGARDELEREKRTLLKAIKEAEFDHQMGKLSKRDVDEMIRNYRLRAIEVIKLLEDSGKPGTPREQIQREVRARLEVEAVRSKIERAHADLGQRRNQKKAAAAAQKAARNAAAPHTAMAAMAQAAARQTDDEADDEMAEKRRPRAGPKRRQSGCGRRRRAGRISRKADAKTAKADVKVDEAKTDRSGRADAGSPTGHCSEDKPGGRLGRVIPDDVMSLTRLTEEGFAKASARSGVARAAVRRCHGTGRGAGADQHAGRAGTACGRARQAAGRRIDGCRRVSGARRGSPASPSSARGHAAVGDAPRVARTDASGRAVFPGLTAGATVRAKIKNAEGNDLMSDPFPVPSAGGMRVMLSTKPFTGGAGPTMSGGGGAGGGGPAAGGMPDARQMSGQPRPDQETPPGTYVVRLTTTVSRWPAG
jgi:hypothetical protein